MSTSDEKVDELQKKQLYKEQIRPYLPKHWREYEIDEFFDKLLGEGLVPVPSSEYDRVLRGLSKKGIFKWMYLHDGQGKRTVQRKYFPNISIVHQIKKKNKT